MIRVQGLWKTYRIGFWRKAVPALRGVDLQVNPGDLFGFIGPNGAGKSTTLKILLGLLRADQGEIELMGCPAGKTEGRAKVGYLPEQPYFYDYLTGGEFLRFYGKLSGLSGAELSSRTGEVAERTRIQTSWLDRRLRTYSKGMLQRIGLAQSLLGRPELLILDEPMSGLDPLGRRDVRLLLQDLHGQGVTICYSTHVLSDVEAVCTRLAMAVGGQIRRQGTVDEVLTQGETHFRLRFERNLNNDERVSAEKLGLVSPLGERLDCSPGWESSEILRTCAEKNWPLTSLEKVRATLEDVLAEEVAKPL
jgi:ABC-2 type transport system ATP-binding protein